MTHKLTHIAALALMATALTASATLSPAHAAPTHHSSVVTHRYVIEEQSDAGTTFWVYKTQAAFLAREACLLQSGAHLTVWRS